MSVCLKNLHIRFVHSGCALTKELPEDKCICLLCKEQHPVTQPHRAEIQTREASEETEGQVDLIEMTIQTDAAMTTEEHIDVPEVTPRHKDLAETGQLEASGNAPIDLGKC